MTNSRKGRITKTQLAEQQFFQFPKLLLFGKKYKESLSANDRQAYVVLKDRLSLSLKNNWIDGNGDAFFYYPNHELCEALGVTKTTLVRIKKTLSEVGLLEEIKTGRANRMYLYEPEATCDEDMQYFLDEPTQKTYNEQDYYLAVAREEENQGYSPVDNTSMDESYHDPSHAYMSSSTYPCCCQTEGIRPHETSKREEFQEAKKKDDDHLSICDVQKECRSENEPKNTAKTAPQSSFFTSEFKNVQGEVQKVATSKTDLVIRFKDNQDNQESSKAYFDDELIQSAVSHDKPEREDELIDHYIQQFDIERLFGLPLLLNFRKYCGGRFATFKAFCEKAIYARRSVEKARGMQLTLGADICTYADSAFSELSKTFFKCIYKLRMNEVKSFSDYLFISFRNVFEDLVDWEVSSGNVNAVTVPMNDWCMSS